MSLSKDQISQLRSKLLENKTKLESVLETLIQEDPKSNIERLSNNADLGTEALESDDLVRSQSLEDETRFMLNRINNSLKQIEEGQYGKTAQGENIPFQRLQIDPTATTLVS